MELLSFRSRRALRAPLLVVAALAVGLALPGTVSAGADPDNAPCRPVNCKTSLVVSGWSQGWRSAEDFYPHNETVLAKLMVGGKPLKMVASAGPNGCRHVFRGSKVEANVKACDSVTPLYIRAVREYPLAVTMRIVYRADPALDGNPNSPGGLSRSARMSRIAGPSSG
ncbi:MAG: hypothetical protein EXQ70_04045 [Solirubrobacterales bacterium]|nr:hypothetical protein [Solirubrobacterales bacterium]